MKTGSLSVGKAVQKYYNIDIASTKPGEVPLRLCDSLHLKFDSRVYFMIKHYILSLNPTAKHDWDRCILRDPLTAKRPDIAKLIAEAVGADTGSYLVSVNIQVEVLEQAAIAHAEQLSLNISEVSVPSQLREVA
jgi:hypothetical protein